jgi:CelD/BcsL family acetyltransferase involved in cellulose biosynthesis
LEFTLHRVFPESIKKEWNTLLEESISHVPFLRYEYLHTWWQTRGGGEWPVAELAIITAEEDGSLIGIAPLFQAMHAGRQALLFLGSIEISDYLDLIVREGDLNRFVEGTLDFLLRTKDLNWENLDLYNLLDGSPRLKVLEQAAEKKGLGFESTRLQHSPFIPLPGDWENYLAGIDKKQRHEIRRKMRRVEEAGTAVRWYIVEDGSTLEAETNAFLSLMENDEDKLKFLTQKMREHIHLTIRCAFDAGCLQLAFLEVNGEKAAGYLSFDYLGRMWIYNSGLDWKFSEYSPGWVLLGNLIRSAIETGHTEFDFMRGDEDYKYRFGAVDRFVLRVVVSSN